MIEFKTSVSEKLTKKLSKQVLPGDEKISILLEGIVRQNGEEYDPGILIITPHHVYAFGKVLGLWSKILTFGFTSIKEFISSVDDRDGFHVRLQANSIIFKGLDYIKGAQVLYRNIKILTTGHKNIKYKFHSNDPDLFPPINLPISCVQSFQFAYSQGALRAEDFYDHTYINDIYKQVRAGDYSFDITQLPENYKAESFAYCVSLSSFFNSFICEFPTEYSPMDIIDIVIQRSVPLSIISISNPKRKEDLGVIASALELKHNKNIIFWKIANGAFKSKRKFIHSIILSTSPIKQIELENIGLEEKHLVTLFKGLTKNKYLWQISRLSIRGSDMTNAAKLEFLNWMTELNTKGITSLQSLDISNTGRNIGKLCHVVSTFATSIKHLSVSDNKFDEWSESQLVQLAMRTPSLISLDVSGCDFDVASVTSVIRAFVSNTDRKEFHMKFGNQNLSAVDMSGCASSLLYSDTQKWKTVDISGTELEHGSALMIFSVFSSLPNLSSIILDGCCSYKLKGIGAELARLIDLPNLHTFSVRGSDSCKLKKEAYPVIQKLSNNNHLIKFDISFNAIGSNGIRMLDDSLTTNVKLEEINADGSGNSSFEILSSLILKLRARPNTLFVEWFTYDAKEIIDSVSRSKRYSMSVQLRSLRADLNMSLSLHRISHGIPNFRTPLLEDVGKSFSNSLNQINSNIGDRYTHTCACDVIGLPLPFQPIAAKAMDYGGKHPIELGQMEIYNTDCMGYIASDGPPLEPELDDIRKTLPHVEIPPIPPQIPLNDKSDKKSSQVNLSSKSNTPQNEIKSKPKSHKTIEEMKAPNLPIPESKPIKISSSKGKSKKKLGIDFHENERFVQKTAPPLELSSESDHSDKTKKRRIKKDERAKMNKKYESDKKDDRKRGKQQNKRTSSPRNKKIDYSISSDSEPYRYKKSKKYDAPEKNRKEIISSSSEYDSIQIPKKPISKPRHHSKAGYKSNKKLISDSDNDSELAKKFKPRRFKSNRTSSSRNKESSSSSDEFVNFKPPRPNGKEIDLGTRGRRFETDSSASSDSLGIPRRMPRVRYN